MKSVVIYNLSGVTGYLPAGHRAENVLEVHIHDESVAPESDESRKYVHSSCFPPTTDMNIFLGKSKNKYPVYFSFPLRDTAFAWIIKLYLAGFRKMAWLEGEKEIRHNLFYVMLVKVFYYIICRIPFCGIPIHACSHGSETENPTVLGFFRNRSLKVLISLLRIAFGIMIKITNKYHIGGIQFAFIRLLSRCEFMFKVPQELRAYLPAVADASRLEQDLGKLKVSHFIGTLGAGGAEGQLAVTVAGMKKAGIDNIKVFTYCPLQGYMAHNLPKLQKAGVAVQELDFCVDYNLYPELKNLPGIIRSDVTAVYHQLKNDPPDVFHTWLDYTNVIGGIAALIAGVPLIVISTRSVNPCHFPNLFKPWFRPYYRLLAESPRVRFINNSTNGGLDYAKWLAVDRSKFKTVLNGVDFSAMQTPAQEKIVEFRKKLNIPSDAFLICGLFRLSPEKRADMFFRVISRVMKKHPHVYAVQAGEGEDSEILKDLIEKHHLDGRFQLLGRRSDIPVILSASDALLLTSRVEGTPNVLLEAQWFGCLPVSTDVGGVSDCIVHGETGFINGNRDEVGLSESLCSLIENKELRESMKKKAPSYIKGRFGIERMLNETISMYKP